MTQSNQENKQSNAMNAFVAGAAGAMVGAAAGAAAVVLADEKNRKIVTQKGSHLLDKAKKRMDQLRQPNVAEKVKSVKRKASAIKQDLLEEDTSKKETPTEN